MSAEKPIEEGQAPSVGSSDSSATPWTDDKENAATVHDHAGQPYEMLPFVLASDARIFERRMRAALTSAREELVRQRAVWTTTKNDAWATACIDTELGRIDRALSLPNNRDEPRSPEQPLSPER